MGVREYLEVGNDPGEAFRDSTSNTQFAAMGNGRPFLQEGPGQSLETKKKKKRRMDYVQMKIWLLSSTILCSKQDSFLSILFRAMSSSF